MLEALAVANAIKTEAVSKASGTKPEQHWRWPEMAETQNRRTLHRLQTLTPLKPQKPESSKP